MACRHILEVPKMAFRRFLLPISSTSVISTHIYPARHVQLSSAHRFPSTVDIYKKPNIIIRARKKFGWTEYPESYYNRVAVLLYESIDSIPVDTFFKEFELEDTFFSWFLVMELHLWMLLITSSKYGKEGECLKKMLATTMWDDVSRRIKLLVNLAASDKRKAITSLHDGMSYALVLYDEGMLTDDKKLAEGLWLRIYKGKTVDPRHLEALVYYIRKQIHHIDLISKENFTLKGKVSWLPFKECMI